jgi:hypothetical protein
MMMCVYRECRGRVVALVCLALWPRLGQAQCIIQAVADSSCSVTGGDDLKQLKCLASGVGHEFEPNDKTSAFLKQVGMKSIRAINVDPLPGKFDETGRFIVGVNGHLEDALDICRKSGADPHVIIANSIHPDLRIKEDDHKNNPELMGVVHSAPYGPNDWRKFQRYCEAYFEYVMVTKGVKNARFEAANGPDIGGVYGRTPPRPANGSWIVLDSRVNGTLIGQQVEAPEGIAEITLLAIGTRPIVTATLVGDGNMLKTFPGKGAREFRACYRSQPLPRGTHWFY